MGEGEGDGEGEGEGEGAVPERILVLDSCSPDGGRGNILKSIEGGWCDANLRV